MSELKGWKVFNPDFTCKDFQYEVGKSYEEDFEPQCCNRGFHFCTELKDCFDYYEFNPNNRVAEIIAYGDIDMEAGNSKCCTNKIKIVREIAWHEALAMVNLGESCTGLCNTGNRNTGNWNTGNWNAGNRNTGDHNTGDRNTGDWNTGDWNTGDHNTGNWNTGNRNTGDWNTTNFSSGCFNTEDQKIMLFNKPSDWTYRDWLESDARYLLNHINKNVVEWVCESNMSNEEKVAHPTYRTTCGYLKVLDESECVRLWWDSLEELERNIIRAIPNFDVAIFEEITGINVNE